MVQHLCSWITAAAGEPVGRFDTLPPASELSSRRASSWARRVSYKQFLVLDALLRSLNLVINIYSIAAFLQTSSLVDNLLMRQASFMDDIVHGVYNLTPLLPVDVKIQSILQQGHAGQSKRIGVRDASLAFPGGNHSLSWCMRVNISLGVQYHTMYNHDGVSRRLLRFVHTNLPPSCVGWTVASGGSHDAPRLHVVDDARSGYGTSYLHCTDQRYYMPPLGLAANVSQFRFRAGYIVAQQRDAGGVLSVETHISQCKAEKIGDSLVYKVSPAIEGDDTEDVNILFGQKSRLLTFLDYVGQLLVFGVLTRELWRLTSRRTTRIPTQTSAYYTAILDTLLHRPRPEIPTLDAGRSVLSLSQLWLANPWYLVGNGMYAIGTTTEVQTLVEVFFWQASLNGNVADLLQAAMYAMRHAWVCVGIWTFLRWLVTTRHLPPGVMTYLGRPIRTIERYCSCRSIVLGFIVGFLVGGFTRGSLYLTERVNVVDMGNGMAEAAVWGSEDMTTLLMCDTFGLLVTALIAVCMRCLLQKARPNHGRNSFLRAIDAHRRGSGFDLAELLVGSRSLSLGTHWVLVLPVADLYLVYSSVNLCAYTAMQTLPRAAPGHALRCETLDDGRTLAFVDAGVIVPGLVALQAEHPGYEFCAVI
ncbi:hypothetical protein SDRG_16495 [Saprolegnia diclina VS20]|uniref:Uncharacterized protein n=1 Tax=Saprolegnia diclina (strain VS20) TaxID=1156394 RepID=T0PX84_SAPDV|nr:hypothetical protein SDRG_16495 [Saprolegnia diclina VS20]EQC25640.1 hypothetical protein SDRG_16495 [Saprolegnia diclina VS20]|eukprot:XP_008620931.1 hypothetical protein SDRG_16495 [Saprolegnia diclina VS20]